MFSIVRIIVTRLLKVRRLINGHIITVKAYFYSKKRTLYPRPQGAFSFGFGMECEGKKSPGNEDAYSSKNVTMNLFLDEESNLKIIFDLSNQKIYPLLPSSATLLLS